MDKREAELLREIAARRAELVARVEVLRRSAVEAFDPRATLRRHPLAGVLTSVAAGIVLGMLPGRRRAEPDNGSRARENPLIATAAGLLPGVLPALVGPLLSLIGLFAGNNAGPGAEASAGLPSHKVGKGG